MNRPFKDWEVDRFTITSPDGKYCLWLCNGFSFFKDYNRVLIGGNEEPLLIGLSLLGKWRVWRAIKKELKQRSVENLKDIGL